MLRLKEESHHLKQALKAALQVGLTFYTPLLLTMLACIAALHRMNVACGRHCPLLRCPVCFTLPFLTAHVQALISLNSDFEHLGIFEALIFPPNAIATLLLPPPPSLLPPPQLLDDSRMFDAASYQTLIKGLCANAHAIVT